MAVIRHHFVQRLREEGVLHVFGVIGESRQRGVLDARTSRHKVHGRHVLHLVALVHPLVVDQSVVSIAGRHLLQLEEVDLGLNTQPGFDTGREFLAFLAKLGIIHHAGLGLKLKMALPGP